MRASSPTGTRPERAARRPRPLTAALLSAIVPGVGQYVARRRARGRALLAVTLVLSGSSGAIAWGVASGAAVDLLGWALQPEGLLTLMVVNLALASFRVFATLDAWRVARWAGAKVGPAQSAGLLLLLGIVVVGPHAAVGYVGAEADRVVSAVFVPRDAAPGSTPVTDPASEPVQADEPTPSDPVPDAPEEVDDVPTAPAPDPVGEPEPREPFAGRERLTALLLGTDAGPGREGARVDVMVVASVHLETGAVSLISVPRNLGSVPMPGVFAERLGTTYPQRLMSLYPEAAADPVLAARYDDAGQAAHVAAVETLLDIPIDHVAMVDMAGFVEVVDAFGGVEIEIGEPMAVRLSPPAPGEEWRTYDIPAGRQVLDGHTAHAYVRSRTGTDDYDRMRRQRCLVGSLARTVDTLRLLRSMSALADVLVERVSTDIPVDLLPDLARLAGRVDVSRVRTLGITPPTYTDGRNAAGFYVPDLPRIRQAVGDLLSGAEDAVPAGASDLDGTCG